MTKLEQIFQGYPFPIRKMENWKYTPLKKLLSSEFNVDIAAATYFDHSELATDGDTLLKQHPFAKLAIINAKKIELLEITTQSSAPIVIKQTQKNNAVHMQHQRIRVAENVHAEILIEYSSEDNTPCFSNVFTEISLEKNATLSMYKKQTLNNHSFLIDYISVNQAENSTFNSVTLDKGAALSRTDMEVHLHGLHATTSLQGVYLTVDEQVADHHSVIRHHAPYCQSKQHYRGVLDGKSKAIFNGKVVFEQDAQKSSTQQLNKNLLLSNQAEIDTKPELEIYADDVKASHGATVGQLDQQALFYLQARGIALEQAKALLMDGFLQEVFLSIENKDVRNSFVEATGGRSL